MTLFIQRFILKLKYFLAEASQARNEDGYDDDNNDGKSFTAQNSKLISVSTSISYSLSLPLTSTHPFPFKKKKHFSDSNIPQVFCSALAASIFWPTKRIQKYAKSKTFCSNRIIIFSLYSC